MKCDGLLITCGTEIRSWYILGYVYHVDSARMKLTGWTYAGHVAITKDRLRTFLQKSRLGYRNNASFSRTPNYHFTVPAFAHPCNNEFIDEARDSGHDRT